MRSKFLIWALAFIITAGSVVFQRMTGPSYPVTGAIEIDNHRVEFYLPRTYENTSPARAVIETADENITGTIHWRRYKSHDEVTIDTLERSGSQLIGIIPPQPAAGKVVYDVFLNDKNGNSAALAGEPVIIRFRDPVPTVFLVPHMVFMSLAMLLSTWCGLAAIAGRENLAPRVILTAVLTFLGGLIFGPIVQKYAFGALWTGWPLGHDLTDNKTAVAMIFWLMAIWRMKAGRHGRAWVITASIVTFVIFLIPHSLLGSELDYTEME